MPRGFGLTSRSVHEPLQRDQPPTEPEPLPEPYAPGPVGPARLGIEDPGDGISFFVLGDVGGIKEPRAQNAVSVAMQSLLAEGQDPAFVLIVGDVVYYNGQQMAIVKGLQTGYLDQFYEPYGHLARPIIAFPGNHDGEREDRAQQRPLQGFMENFCSEEPGIPVDDPQLEYGRHTQTLPYCEWTLNLGAATIVAVYTNVPSHGYLEERQEERLVKELQDADADKKLIVGLHHPPYSLDSHHGESEPMQEMLDRAFAKAGRTPDLILSGHVHNYQRFARAVQGKELALPYIVSGNGGYYNKHKLAEDAVKGDEVKPGVTYEYGDDERYGFLRLTIKDGVGEGEYFAVEPGEMPDGSEMRLYRAEDQFTF